MATYLSESFSPVEEEVFDETQQSSLKKNIFKEYKDEFLKILGSNYCSEYVERVPEARLQIVKKYFEKEVQSPRRLSYANTLSDIIFLLIKLDILNEEDTAPLATIASILENGQLQTLARSYEKKIQAVSNNVPVSNKKGDYLPIENGAKQNDQPPTSNQILPNDSFVLNQNTNPSYNYQFPTEFQNHNFMYQQKFPSLNTHQSLPMTFGALPFNLPVIPPQNYCPPNHSFSATLPNVPNPQPVPQLSNNCQFYPSVPMNYYQPYQQNGQHSLPLNLQQENVLQFDNDFETKKAKVYSAIADDLGLSWKEFARSIPLKEGNIDNIEQNVNSLRDKIHQVFKVWENQLENNPAEFKRTFRTKLESALEKSRRNDIKKRIINMLDSN